MVAWWLFKKKKSTWDQLASYTRSTYPVFVFLASIFNFSFTFGSSEQVNYCYMQISN